MGREGQGRAEPRLEPGGQKKSRVSSEAPLLERLLPADYGRLQLKFVIFTIIHFTLES